MDKQKSKPTLEFHPCPKLGLEIDSETWIKYPSIGNHCHHNKPPQKIMLAHQEQYCLSTNYTTCPIFQTQSTETTSKAIGQKEDAPRQQKKIIVILAIVVFAIIIIVSTQLLFISNSPEISNHMQSSSTQESINPQTGSPTIPLAASQTPTVTPNQFMLILPTTEPLSSPTVTPSQIASEMVATTPSPLTPTPGPGIQTPFGEGNKYLLHRVGEGESLSLIATMYDTNIDVIQATNILIEGASIWPNTILVIIPGQKDPTGLPKFRVLLLEASASVQSLAEQYNVSEAKLREYNSLGSDNFIPANRWLIIPVTIS